MIKKHIPKVVIGLLIVIVVGSLTYSIVHYEQHQKVLKAQVAAEHTQAAKVAQAQQTKVNMAESKLLAVTKQRDAICAYVTGLVSAPATRGRVTVPVVDCTK